MCFKCDSLVILYYYWAFLCITDPIGDVCEAHLSIVISLHMHLQFQTTIKLYRADNHQQSTFPAI